MIKKSLLLIVPACLLLVLLFSLPSCGSNPAAPAPVTVLEPVTILSTATFTPTGSATPTFTITWTPTKTYSPTSTWTPVTIFSTPTSSPTGSPTPTATITLSPTPPFSAVVTIGSGVNMNQPLGIQAIGGNIWVANLNGNTLQKWTTLGVGPSPNISTFNGSFSFNQPFGVGGDPSTGNIYAANRLDKEIEVFDSAGTYLTTFGNAEFGVPGAPSGVAVNSSGTTVYAVDQGRSVCYAWSISGSTYTFLFFFGNSGIGGLGSYPQMTHLDTHGNVWVADTSNSRAVEYGPHGSYLKAVTLADSGTPSDVVVDSSDNVFVTDTTNSLIAEFNSSGQLVNSMASLATPGGMTFDSTGNFLYVSDQTSEDVVGFQKN